MTREAFHHRTTELLLLNAGMTVEEAIGQTAREEVHGRTPRMADLKPGTRVRHIGGDTGAIRVAGGVTEFHPDDWFGDMEVSPEGPVFPADLEILAGNGSTS